jgi:hypothetical protein
MFFYLLSFYFILDYSFLLCVVCFRPGEIEIKKSVIQESFFRPLSYVTRDFNLKNLMLTQVALKQQQYCPDTNRIIK